MIDQLPPLPGASVPATSLSNESVGAFRKAAAGMDWDIAPGTGLPLDPGIKPYVMALSAAGVETFESCEGGEGHAFPDPTIRFHGGVGEGFRAFGIARVLGLPVFQLRLSYTVQDGVLTGPWWEITFATKAKEGP